MAKIKVAVTGGIGSGKSTAIRCIKDMGYPVFSCDEIYKEVIASPEYVEKIQTIFPEVISGGRIERAILSEIVFESSEKREQLNAIAHPLIMKKLYEYMDSCADEVIFAEVPLLFEGEFEHDFDQVIVIERNDEKRIASVRERDNISDGEIKKRIKAQFDYFSIEGKLRLKNCNAHILKNEGTVKTLYTKLEELISLFKT